MTQSSNGTRIDKLAPSASVTNGAGAGRVAPATAVLICEGLQTCGKGLDLKELCRWLEGRHPGVVTRIVPDLCHAPDELRPSATAGAERIVLGLCSQDYAEREMHSRARKAGLDPLGIELVNLGAFCALVQDGAQGREKAKLLLAAAVAKERAYPGSRPENLRPSLLPLSQKVSRRALFTLPPIRYQVVATINAQRCIADSGCALCVQACPRGALENVGGEVQIEKMRCDGCGLCLAACPQCAIQLPGASPEQLEAQVIALLETDLITLPERRILFTCQRSVQAMEDAGRDGVASLARWLPVQVPCAGMVPVSCFLGCLARGADEIGVVCCGDGCPFNQSETIRGRIDYCQQLLRLTDGSPHRIKLVRSEDKSKEEQTSATGKAAPRPRSEGGGPRPLMFGPKATGDVLRELAEEGVAPATIRLEHPYSPVGIVAVEPLRCTGCGVCGGSCATGALAFHRDNEEVALTFDGGLCIGCGQCVAGCPEAGAGAIRVDRVTDFARLKQGRVKIYQDKEARCETCGAPVAPLSMLNKMAAMLGNEDAALADLIGRRCLSCRGTPQGILASPDPRPSSGIA